MSLNTEKNSKNKLKYQGGSLFGSKKPQALPTAEVKVETTEPEPTLETKKTELESSLKAESPDLAASEVVAKDFNNKEVVESAKPKASLSKKSASNKNWLKAKNVRGKEDIDIYTEHLRYTAEFMAGQIDEVKLQKRRINSRRSKELKMTSPISVNSIYRAAMELYIKASKNIDFENIVDEDDLINRVVSKI